MSEKDAGKNLVTSWAEAQQKLLKNWVDTVQKFGGAPTRELWTKTVDAWQSSVQETLETQEKWMRQWTEALAKTQGTPEQLRELLHRGQEQLQQWTEVERDLWQGWFNAMRQFNFISEPWPGMQSGKDLVQLWQDAARNMINAQTEFVQRWTGSITEKKKQS